MADIENKYSLIIIGSGPAALTASIYASRYRIEHLIIGEALGGLAFEAHKICNFPTEKEITGIKLTEKLQRHIESLGATIMIDKVIKIVQEDKVFKITTQKGKIFLTDVILLAVGTEHRCLNLPNEDKFLGKGISYCSTCDAMFYRNKIVAVSGGANSANTASIHLAQIAKKVYQIYRKDKLRGDVIWAEQVINNKKIEIIYNTEIIGLEGKDKLERIVLDSPYKNSEKINIDGLFVEIGTIPQKMLIEQLSLETNKNGYIKVDSGQKTSLNGIWAAGDITTASNNFHQIITACSEGAIAVENIFKFLKKL